MPADQLLDTLVECERNARRAHEAAAAALAAYRGDAAAEPEDDLVSLRDAEAEFRRSNKQLRRWANEEGLGVEVDGRLYLRRSLVRQFKNVQERLPDLSR